MSTFFGPIVQQGYIVPDMDQAIASWVARGVGPFFILDDHVLQAEHYGKPVTTHIVAAFACSGSQQIELIQPLADSGPNVYSDYLAGHPEGGLQHVAMWCDDVDAKLAELTAQGVDYTLAQRYEGTHAYLDMADHPGVMIQLMPTFERYLDLFKVAQIEAQTWDGKTEPVRRVNW